MGCTESHDVQEEAHTVVAQPVPQAPPPVNGNPRLNVVEVNTPDYKKSNTFVFKYNNVIFAVAQ